MARVGHRTEFMDSFSSQRRTRGSLKPVLIAVGAAFLLGASVVGYFSWRGQLDFTPVGQANTGDAPEAGEDTLAANLVSPQPSPSPTSSEAAEEAAELVEEVAEQQGGLDQRLAAAEQRLARLDLQAQAAAGNAARAEGLLIAFATRRAIERGAELGYLADQLRLRFGDALPNAVEAVISFSREPVTLDVLVAQLEGLTPSLVEPEQETVWARFQREMGELFVIRHETTPSPEGGARLERARFFLESGRVARAIEEVRQLPGANNAEGWIASAERYAEAHRALDLIETSAVLEPRRLRDGFGNRIEQPSPVGESEQN